MASKALIADILRVMSITMWPMRILTVLILLMPLAAQAAQAAIGTAKPPPDSVHYRNCVAASSANPAAALADAEAWAKQGGSVPAQHCAARSPD